MNLARAPLGRGVSSLIIVGLGTGATSCLGDSGESPFTTSGPTSTGGATSTTAPPNGTDSNGGSGPTDTDSGGPGSTGSNPTDSTATSGPLKFDVGTILDVPPMGTDGEDDGCKKIDFLFVIDNSGSMRDNQISLANSFPGFIDAIQSEVVKDFHIMVVDTDAPDGLPMSCEDELGTGLTWDENQNDCGITSGRRYMLDDQPTLAETFECLALAGSDGSSRERPMESMVESISRHNLPGNCNGGFVRNDAVLVITFITDEPDDGKSLGDPATWKAAVVRAKNGNEDAVVVLGLLGDTALPGAVCGPAEDGPRLREFADSFNFGGWASVCLDNYAPFFADAVSSIKGACDIFQPPE